LLGRHNGNEQYGIELGMPYLSLTVINPQFEDREVGTLHLGLDERPEGQRAFTLKSFPWTQPATVWKTVTPLVLRQHASERLALEERVSEACVDSGYPVPVAVRVSLAPLINGVPHSRSFHLRLGQSPSSRLLVHAEIEFPMAIPGPVLIGEGRNAGYGAFRPDTRENMS